MANFRVGAGNIQRLEYISFFPRVREYSQTKETQAPTERAPIGQHWNNMNNRINNTVLDYNPKHKLCILEGLLSSPISKTCSS